MRLAGGAVDGLAGLDEACLTGDGDFLWLLDYLSQAKAKIWLLASPRKTATELKKLFGPDFASLDNLRPRLEYQDEGHTQNEADSTNDSASGMTGRR